MRCVDHFYPHRQQLAISGIGVSVCLLLCAFVYVSTRYLENQCSKDYQTYHRRGPPCVLETHLFWGQKVKVTWHKKHLCWSSEGTILTFAAGLCLCHVHVADAADCRFFCSWSFSQLASAVVGRGAVQDFSSCVQCYGCSVITLAATKVIVLANRKFYASSIFSWWLIAAF